MHNVSIQCSLLNPTLGLFRRTGLLQNATPLNAPHLKTSMHNVSPQCSLLNPTLGLPADRFIAECNIVNAQPPKRSMHNVRNAQCKCAQPDTWPFRRTSLLHNATILRSTNVGSTQCKMHHSQQCLTLPQSPTQNAPDLPCARELRRTRKSP